MIKYIYNPPQKSMPGIKKLFIEYSKWLGFDLSFQDFENELENLPGKYGPPGGAIILAEENGIPAGCVALRKFGTEGNKCEMKRLFVPDNFKKRGIGKELVCRIIAQGLSMGYDSMLLDTLSTMGKARGLYTAAGFKKTDPYYHNPLEGALFMELDLKEKNLIRDNLRSLYNFSGRDEKPFVSYIFDFGGVIGFHQKKEELFEIGEMSGAKDFNLFEKAYKTNRHGYDAGIIDGKHYWGKVISDAGVSLNEKDYRKLIDMDTKSWTRINHETVDIIRTLKSRGAFLALLSNMPHEMLAFIRENKNKEFSWLENFDFQLFSCEVNICKPDPSIYALCLEKSGIDPERSVFIDDMEDNIRGAGKCGIRGIHFDGTDRLKADLGLIS
ncbi:MAG: HAD-IA family hydrolase [Spirochaetia bacterium]|jgi:HAD superfamily hydrolase (TIGR01509 family)|nr:HAD-IA family hydrolase [Spirochaetia bacterium]